MANYNINQKGAIDLLVMAGFDIFELDMGEKFELYCVTTFEKPSTGSISSSPFMRITGWEITELIINTSAVGNGIALISQVKALQQIKKRPYEFSDKYLWKYYQE